MTTRVYYPAARANVAILPQGSEFGAGELMRLEAVKPVSVTIERTSPSEADTVELELEESIFPVDPRLVRSAAVDIFVGDRGSSRDTLEVGGRTRAFVGTVDEIRKAFPGDETDKATLEGRDYSSLLLDEKWQNLAVDLGRPLDQIVAEVVGAFPQTSRLKVVSLGFDEVPEVPAGDGNKRGQYKAKKSATIWEGLQGLADRVAAIIKVEGDEVVIRPPRSVRADEEAPVFVAGRNLSSLEISKEYGGGETPAVRVKAVDPSTFETVTGMYPKSGSDAEQVSRRGGEPSATEAPKIEEFQIEHPNPTSGKLRKIAERIRKRREQQQLSVSFETREMDTWQLQGSEIGADTLDRSRATFDVPQITNGDTVHLWLERGARETLRRATTPREKARELERRGFNRRVAEELAKGWRNVNAPLFVRSATHSLSSSGEYSCSIEAENRITVEG